MFRLGDKTPEELTPKDVLDYTVHLRRDRENGDSSVNRAVVVIRNFYRALIAMEQLHPDDNPLVGFPKLKKVPQTLPKILSPKEIGQLIKAPGTDTVIGVRDTALITLLYATGIRSSECAGLRECDVDLSACAIMVTGKGGGQRTIILSPVAAKALRSYRHARGLQAPEQSFFLSMRGKGMSRNAIYERIRTNARRAGIHKPVSPHWLRHTCATELVKAGEKVVVIQELLGHKSISSTQVYFHVSGELLREAAERHPIGRFESLVQELLPGVKLPFKYPPRRAGFG
jgi:site-specific recombinase XerD